MVFDFFKKKKKPNYFKDFQDDYALIRPRYLYTKYAYQYDAENILANNNITYKKQNSNIEGVIEYIFKIPTYTFQDLASNIGNKQNILLSAKRKTDFGYIGDTPKFFNIDSWEASNLTLTLSDIKKFINSSSDNYFKYYNPTGTSGKTIGFTIYLIPSSPLTQANFISYHIHGSNQNTNYSYKLQFYIYGKNDSSDYETLYSYNQTTTGYPTLADDLQIPTGKNYTKIKFSLLTTNQSNNSKCNTSIDFFNYH